MAHLSVSSGCFITHDYKHVRDMLSKTNTDMVEIIVYRPLLNDMSVIKETFSCYDKEVYSLHAPKIVQTMLSHSMFQENALDLMSRALATASDLGASIMVIHAWDGRYRDLPMDAIKGTVSRLSEMSLDMGVNLSIEALPSKFKRPQDLVRDMLDSIEGLSFTLDFEYAAAYDMFDSLLELSDRLSNVHLRDYDGSWMVDGKRAYLRPGLGTLDFKDLISRIRSRGYDSAYTLEAPYGCVDEINSSIDYFKPLI